MRFAVTSELPGDVVNDCLRNSGFLARHNLGEEQPFNRRRGGSGVTYLEPHDSAMLSLGAVLLKTRLTYRSKAPLTDAERDDLDDCTR